VRKKREKSFTIPLTITYDYYPGYEPPFAGSRDDIRYSDPGEPPYVDNIQIFLEDFVDDIDLTKLIKKHLPKTYAQLEILAQNKGAEW